MIVVPTDHVFEVEALLVNRDIDFVREGQAAEVKIEAFPFSKYGVINAEIVNVSNDAIPDENLGLVYYVSIVATSLVLQLAAATMLT